MRRLLSAALIAVAPAAHADLTLEARSQHIALCLGQGGISVRRADQAGEVVREADVVSVIEALPPNERLRGSELMKDCRA
ncbi:MAG: hypothetical protein AAGA32_17350, partial [Pseudomonadota bacterium]